VYLSGVPYNQKNHKKQSSVWIAARLCLWKSTVAAVRASVVLAMVEQWFARLLFA
jgi:hypothetical protein